MKKLKPIAAVIFIMLFLSTCSRAPADEETAEDCLNAMVDAAVIGDDAAGLAAESERELILRESGCGGQSISYRELSVLARFIASQAEGGWLSDELRLCVGEVALNRLACESFPDSVEEVGAQFGVAPEDLAAIRPSRACVLAALRLLQGERLLSPEVYYISREKQGDIFATFYSRLRGYTYFLTAQ